MVGALTASIFKSSQVSSSKFHVPLRCWNSIYFLSSNRLRLFSRIDFKVFTVQPEADSAKTHNVMKVWHSFQAPNSQQFFLWTNFEPINGLVSFLLPTANFNPEIYLSAAKNR